MFFCSLGLSVNMRSILCLALSLLSVGNVIGVDEDKCFLPGQCIDSYSIDITTSLNDIECLGLCKNTETCEWFTFFRTLQSCQLFRNCTAIDVDTCSDCYSGQKRCDFSEPKCWISGECEGNSIFAEQVQSEMECLRHCQMEDRCRWFTYYLPGSACFLFSDCETFDETSQGCVSGERRCNYITESTTSTSTTITTTTTTTTITGYTKVLVALGLVDSSTEIADVEIIDLLSPNTICQNLPDFPIETYRASGGLGFQEKPLICGGNAGDQTACYLYEDGGWKPSNPFLEGRQQFAMAPSPFPDGNSKLFATGGNDGSSLRSSEILTTFGWQQSVPLPVSIYVHCLVTVNSTTVMAISGYQNGATSEKTYLFNSETNAWAEGPPLETERKFHSCATIRSNGHTQRRSIITVGGYDLSSVEVLDLLYMDAWSRGPDLPIPISDAAMVEEPYGGVVLIGGLQRNVKYLDTLYRLPHAGADAVWEELPQRLKTPRAEFTAFLVPDDITVCSQK